MQDDAWNSSRAPLETPISIEVEEAPLKILLTTIEDLASPPGSDKDPSRKVKILIDEKAFKTESNGMFDLERLPAIKLPGKLSGVSLATALRLITEQIDGTFWVRRDYIEIVPAGMAIKEKVIRVFPVEDLVIPIPKSINTQSLNQSLQVLGASTQFAGQANMSVRFRAVSVESPPARKSRQPNRPVLPGNRGGQVNLGGRRRRRRVRWRSTGQFGNLGGQFGFQGGTQDTILVKLITEVVAKGEWTNTSALLGRARLVVVPMLEGMEGESQR